MGFLIFWIPLMVVCQILIVVQSVLRGALAYARVLNILAAIFLVVNLLCAVLLLALRRKWKREGRLELGYVVQFGGWRRMCLTAGRYLLIPAAIWEFLMAIFCAFYLIVQPLQYIAPYL